METVLFYFLIFLLTLVGSTGVEVEEGGDCEMECVGPLQGTVSVLKWFKLDPHKQKYLVFYRGGKELSKYQDQTFKNRVEIRDRDFTNGTLSVTLRGVRVEDSGTYRCEAGFDSHTGRQEVSQEVYINVRPAGELTERTRALGRSADEEKSEIKPQYSVSAEAGDINVAVIAGISGAGLLVCVALALLFFNRNSIKEWLKRFKTPTTPSGQALMAPTFQT